jgi:hypothetical protein
MFNDNKVYDIINYLQGRIGYQNSIERFFLKYQGPSKIHKKK